MPTAPVAAPTRQRLLAAARDELVRRDGQLEMQAVARAAEVVPSVVIHHFGSRAGLVAAVIGDYFDRLHAEVLDRDLRHLGTWGVRELERTRRGVRFHFTEPLAPVIYGSLARDEPIARAEAARTERVVLASARNISAAQRAGELPGGVQPRLAAAAIFGAIRQVIITATTSSPRPSQKAVVDQLWRITSAAVVPTPQEIP